MHVISHDFHGRILDFMFQSLLAMKDDADLGDDVFAELFFDRYGNRDQITHAIGNNDDVALIGSPGQGKTTLMHYLFSQLAANDTVFPIILDYRRARPRDEFGLMSEFSRRMQLYFRAIDRPISTINEEPTPHNYDLHYAKICAHLDSIPHSFIASHRRLVLFLDDLDYMDTHYLAFLKKYFLSYSISEKVVVILSGRRPLFNALSEDDELYHAFRMRPVVVEGSGSFPPVANL
ncbi:MAG: hypothetical protein DIJKHBIC_01267 [Thermoanaerobaculia bacterium]|nr:hypothetical protein [Thermoanaerobaculia bacterium]